ncbi:MAG: hypothetical protein KF723_21055 [Rhizobiaceae bacterium]|nr:hypothetical protein [Rhizobiaceae bacterium]
MASFTISGTSSTPRSLVGVDLGEVLVSGVLNAPVYMRDYSLLRVWGKIADAGGVSLEPDTADAKIHVYSTGSIAAASGAIRAEFSAGVNIVNEGNISAVLSAISITYKTGLWTIYNWGRILSTTAAGIEIDPSQAGADPSVSNMGLIMGKWGVTSQAKLTLNNFGTISGTKWAIVTFGHNDFVANSGTIRGQVDLEHGNNVFSGSTGRQTYVQTGNGTDTIMGGVNSETLKSLGGRDTILGAGGHDQIFGGSGNDRLDGGGGNDKIFGEIGNDLIIGSAGNDRLNGGPGLDTISGGPGNDIFIFNTPVNRAHRDIITDFANRRGNNDVFHLENQAFKKLGKHGALNPDFFVNGKAAQDGNDYLIYNRALGTLSYDSNGSQAGGVTLIATLLTKPVLTALDFVVI